RHPLGAAVKHVLGAAEGIAASRGAVPSPAVPSAAQRRRGRGSGRASIDGTLKMYPAFKDFYGLEETIERIVGFFRHAAQGLEEKKQILYLLGPVGGGKSSLADRLKDLMEKCPVYVLATNDGVSPIFESALGLFDPASMGPMLEERYGIPQR